ncbi:MAG: hypothetical protein U0T02_14390 [Solirubrobacteraceae bacterium]
MPRIPFLGKFVPWLVLLQYSRLVLSRAQKGYTELSERERSELARIVRKSKGLRRNVTDREFAELRRLVGKALKAAALPS